MPHSLVQEARSRVREALLGSTLDKCSRWAQNRIWMPEHNGRPPGWYSFDDFPWVREILDSRATWNWVMKGAQTGLTVSGMVRGAHEVDFFGRDTMYLLPTDRAAGLFSKTRLASLIKLSPYLRARVEDSIEVKQIGHHCLYVRGANGDINVKSTPVSRLILDEVDEMQERQLWLAFERLSGHTDKVVWGMSTPKFPNHGIHKLYIKSTQEHFFFECPHCRKEIELIWPESFTLRGESVDDPDCYNSYLKCQICGDMLDHERKSEWLKDGYWKATNLNADKNTRGFHLSQLYSGSVSPGELAIGHLRGVGDEDARREFHNSKLGLPYLEDGSQVNDVHIDNCVQKYSMSGSLPRLGTKEMITLGIDQGAFHHYVAVQWDIDLKSKLGDVNDRARGKVIGAGRILQDDWDQIHQLMRMFQVRACVVDFFPDPTSPRAFARKFRGFVWLCQYVVGRGAREIKVEQDEFGASIVKVDKTGWLSKTFGRLMTSEIAFPLDIPNEFRRQLKNQIRTLKKGVDGNRQAAYVCIGDDHYGHALNYAEIALRMLDIQSMADETMTEIR